VSDEIVLVQSLHDHDDHARGFVIQTGKQRAVEPFIDASALSFRNRFIGFQRIVDDDEIGAAPGQHAADRSRVPKAASRGGELVQACPWVGQTGREQSGTTSAARASSSRRDSRAQIFRINSGHR
jgi:hypothetical protein